VTSTIDPVIREHYNRLETLPAAIAAIHDPYRYTRVDPKPPSPAAPSHRPGLDYTKIVLDIPKNRV